MPSDTMMMSTIQYDDKENTQCMNSSSNDGTIRVNKKQKVLVMIDYDGLLFTLSDICIFINSHVVTVDTLIPSSIIKAKQFKMNKKHLNRSERADLKQYVDALNTFMDKLLFALNYNKDNNIIIVTNASSGWVSEGSLLRTGSLFADYMKPFHAKLAKYDIRIVSSFDYMKKNEMIFGGITVKMRHYKRYLMRLIYDDYFGKKLVDFDSNLKIISIGDSRMEFKACSVALNSYLSKQKQSVLDGIDVSLHRIKFVKKPDSFKVLSKQLLWCSDHIFDIIRNKHSSRDYILST